LAAGIPEKNNIWIIDRDCGKRCWRGADQRCKKRGQHNISEGSTIILVRIEGVIDLEFPQIAIEE